MAQREPTGGTVILATMSVLVMCIAGVMVGLGLTSWLEAASFVTGAICVWLTVRENVWNFPIGLVNSVTFGVVFFHASLLTDAGLQGVYFVLGVLGWRQWVCGGENRTTLRITLASWRERGVVTLATLALTAGLWQLVWHLKKDDPKADQLAIFADALTTAVSLAAQWLLNYKRLENWLVWIFVDVLYVPLYLYKGLHLTAVLYGVFLVMAIIGFLRWRKMWRAERAGDAAPAAAEVAA